MENFLKVKLVDRDSREIRLTPAGEIFLPYARRIFNLQRQARRELSLYAGAERGSLEIGGSNTPGQYILPAVIGRLATDRENIEIRLQIGDSQNIIEKVSDGGLEIGLVGNPAPGRELISEKCRGDQLLLVATPATAARLPRLESVEQLKKLPLVLRSRGSGTRQSMLTELKKRGLARAEDLHPIAEMGSAEAVRQAVRGNLGCAIISNLCVADDLAAGTLVSLELPGGPICRNFYLIHSREHRLSPLAQLLKEMIMGN